MVRQSSSSPAGHSDTRQPRYHLPERPPPASKVCRVYANELHPEWCGFNRSSGPAIGNGRGDCAQLRDDQG